jgi:zinc D-Ala-D-Ala dipeptidase
MNKIIHRCQLLLICTVVFLLSNFHTKAQDTILNKYGLWVINTAEQLKKTCQHDVAKKMIDIKKVITGIVLDLRYATVNNFMHEKLYPSITTTFLRKAAADSLAAVQNELKQKGFGLKIFDAYRPYAVTERLWEPVKDDRYAADPKKGSGHNRGIAVDLTIIRLDTKEELDMGTGFDNFSDTAHHTFSNLPADVVLNRFMLKSIMEKHGFKALDTEWWHYYLPNTAYFELLDISFKELGKIKN